MKVMIVDDSIVFRSAISQALEVVPEIDVFKTASNGKVAVDFLHSYPEIDFIILDMEMPVLDGMETIKQIRKFNKDVNIIVFSSTTLRGAEKTIDALHFGADDFVPKIEGSGTIDDSIEMIKSELLPRIKGLFKHKSKRSEVEAHIQSGENEKSINIESIVSDMAIKPKLIVMGSSTGGPEALATVLKKIDHKLTIPILLVQHMPPVFTAKLAEMLSKASDNDVKEAVDGETPEPGFIYLAPGDYHMELGKDYKLTLNQKEKVCFVRPSVDVLFKSVSANQKGQVLSIVLTGMGEDGANGCVELKKYDAYQFIQNKKSCIVWGMPGAVHERNVGAQELDLTQISNLINLVSRRL